MVLQHTSHGVASYQSWCCIIPVMVLHQTNHGVASCQCGVASYQSAFHSTQLPLSNAKSLCNGVLERVGEFHT